ncbi:MAG: hypothetical protein HY340_02085 [Candidatus Kerfeldbacteria bacterium]|nr:hypothetical protein [Candidatus Kerfeldbacteria bacterium]
MGTWLDTLQQELETSDVTSSFEPNGAVQPNEHVVGDITDPDLRRVYSLSMRYSKSALDAKTALAFESQRELQEHYQLLMCQNAARAEVLIKLFWVSVKDAFKLWGRDNIGIRRGWKVVWYEESRPQLPPFLRGLLGD